MAPSKHVREWLQEYKALSENEQTTYAATIRNNGEVTAALYALFQDEELSHEVIEPVCHQLFDFYRSEQQQLRRFTLDLVPALISAYLLAASRNEKKKCTSIEVCLLGIYNLETVDRDGKAKVQTFTIPTLAASSIYHEPPSLATLALTESALMRYHSDEPIVLSIGPMPQIETVTAQNRLTILTYILNIYNAQIGLLSPNSHRCFCDMCSRLTKTGFDHLSSDATDTLNRSAGSGSSQSSRGGGRGVLFVDEPRVPLSADFLIECLNGLYFTIFNGQASEGVPALENINMRASYELFPDVLLVTSAIRNSLQYNPSGEPEDGPMGISIALSPTENNPAFRKDAITNASFRTKRMPEDIEVPEGAEADNPPLYDEIVESDQRSSRPDSSDSRMSKLSKPLKSIMKKGGSGGKGTVPTSASTRSKADASRHRASADTTDSPKHSASVSGSLSSSMNGGTSEYPGVDLSAVRVQVNSARGGAAVTVDTVELGGTTDTSLQRRTTSYPEEFIGSGNGPVNGGEVEGSESSLSLDTQL